VTPGPGHRKCTAYLWPGPGGAPLALPLTEGLGLNAPRVEAQHILVEVRSSGCCIDWCSKLTVWEQSTLIRRCTAGT